MYEGRQEKLREFTTWASQHITGDEKSQAHIFLDRLFQAFGQRGCLDVGGSPEYRIRKATEDGGGTAFADYVWKPVVLIEMKKRGADLSRHYRQAFDYWTRLVPNRPRYVILSNFDTFNVYDFDKQVDSPVDTVELTDLPTRWEPLAFLFPTNEKPRFGNDRVAVTREAADKLALCYRKLIVRGVERATAQRFILQSLVALFAEDIGLLPKSILPTLLDECKEPRDSYDILGGLFEAMNSPTPRTGGRYKGVRYFNGGLFSKPACIELHPDEVAQLQGAATSNWSKVSPEIFGTIFEHTLSADPHDRERHAYGAHYTTAVDIRKIIKPTIVDPWTDAIESARTLTELRRLLERLRTLRVLDPACGSGNFLYIAYREMKALEARTIERMGEFRSVEPAQRMLGFVTARQFYGMDILPFAIELAKVTMMIGRKLAIDELHISESDLPLDNLDGNFIRGDALMSGGNQTAWPPADLIIGNPPFLGAKRLKPEHGTDYANRLRKLYPEIPGMADYCVYWIRRAHDHLPECTEADPFAGRAGLVGTQNVRNNQSRVGGLDHVVKTGTIIEAVDNQPWSGDADVHVSIVNWVKTQDPGILPKKRLLWQNVQPAAGAMRKKGVRADKDYELVVRECAFLNSSLSDETDSVSAMAISANTAPQRIFQGVTPGHAGFVLSPEDRNAMIEKDPVSAGVVHAYLIGRELVSGDGRPERFLIDFEQMTILEVQRYKAAFTRIRDMVLPDVKAKADAEEKGESARKSHLDRWWMLWRGRADMLAAFASLKGRAVASSRTQRIPFVFTFISTDIRPGDKLQTFAFDDDYSFGIIQSGAHCAWYEGRTARLKNEEDYNYSSQSVFDTFPWPQSPTKKQIDAVAAAGREIRRVRTEALQFRDDGLRALYRTLELPGKNPLKDAHAALDEAVLAAYGFAAKKDLLAQLLELNHVVAAKEKASEAVTAPGIPATYGPDTSLLITEDCIRP